MNTAFIQGALIEQIEKHSRLDKHRNYLGISRISDCPHKAVYEFIHGIPINEESHRMSFAGYEHEASILSLLLSAGVITQVNVEVVAPFDDRLRGHVDAVSSGDMLEIKSASTNKFQQIVQTRKAIRKHYIQVQLYLHYGGWKQAFIIYRCRETYEHFTLHIPYNFQQAERFERRAKMMLAHIHRGELPDCECGNCK